MDLLAGLLGRFVRENEDPRASPHLRAAAPDRLDALVALLGRADLARRCPDLRQLVLKATKILARRQDVRLRCTPQILQALAPLLAPAPAPTGGKPAPGPAAAAAAAEASECANAVSNLCYEPANATALLKAGGVERLLQLLAATPAADCGPSNTDAQVNAAGALQTISFQPDGRAALLRANAPVTVLAALQRCDGGEEEGAESASGGAAADAGRHGAESRLAQRLVGALHNMSSSAEGVAAIRQAGGIRPIVRFVSRRDGDRGLAAAAAGALQNLSLEAAAAADIQADPQALPALAALLVGADTQVRVRAGMNGRVVRLTAAPQVEDSATAAPALPNTAAAPHIPCRPRCAPPARWQTLRCEAAARLAQVPAPPATKPWWTRSQPAWRGQRCITAWARAARQHGPSPRRI